MSDGHRALLRYFLLAAFIQILWGVTPSASQLILEYLPVEGYSSLRYTFSGLLFLGVTLYRHGRLSVRRADLANLALLGVLTYAIDSLGTLYGMKTGGVVNFALASSLNAVISGAVLMFVLGERPTRAFAVGAGLSIVGGLFLLWGKYEVSSWHVAGLSLVLIWGAYVFEALGFAYSKRYKSRLPLTEYIGILQLSAGIFMGILALGTGRMPTGLASMPGLAWGALVYVCLISCGLCYFVLYWLLNHIEGHRLAFFDAFHTLSAALFGALFFSEPFNLKMAVGGLLLLAAVIVVTRGRAEQPAEIS